MQPNGVCPTRIDVFIQGTQPTQPDTYWQTVELNSETGQRATPNTNPALVVERDYFVPPPEAEDWWLANNLPVPPTTYDTTSRPDILNSAVILEPAELAYVGGMVDVRGSMVTTEMQRYQLLYGVGDDPMRPDQWLVIAESETFTPGTSLGIWDTTGLNGLYNLQLRVILNDNTLETSSAVLVTVDNTPPSVVLIAGEEGQVFRWPTDTVIPLFAQVQDNYRLDRVVFYRNGLEVGVSDDCFLSADGCRFDFDIDRPGNEVFRVVVYDVVGNSSFSEITVEIVRESG
jgi:hypothetical protein